MSLLVRAFPLKAPVAALERFTADLKGPRQADAKAFYAAHGVAHESWYLQQTDSGPWVIGITQVENVPENAPRFAKAKDEFSSWFKQQILELTGVDTSTAPLGPATQLVYSCSDCEETAETFAPPPPL
jgi:hypothetical protein